MNFHLITIFPNIFNSYFNESIIKRAQEKKIINIKTHDLRKWTNDKHNTVDDKPYGGGAGMVLMAEPISKALQSLKKLQITNYKLQKNSKSKKLNSKIVLLSAKGKKWNQTMAKKYAKLDNIILICGRYEGVDERVTKVAKDMFGAKNVEEISIGEYVLTGGEIPAMTIIDSIARLLPGVLGNKDSAKFESHSEAGKLEHPQYTRPEILEVAGKKYKVPKVLLSGDHKKIKEWKNKKSKKI